jgi:hypothetical protein
MNFLINITGVIFWHIIGVFLVTKIGGYIKVLRNPYITWRPLLHPPRFGFGMQDSYLGKRPTLLKP